MIVIYVLLALWLGLAVGHAIGVSKQTPRERPVPDTASAELRLAHQCLYLVAHELDSRRPVAWWLRRRWPEFCMTSRTPRAGDVARAGWHVEIAHVNIDIDTRELAAGDPGGKAEAAARLLAARLKTFHIGAFVMLQKHRHLYFCHPLVDHVSGVSVRLLRGYDIETNSFITRLDAMVVVADKS